MGELQSGRNDVQLLDTLDRADNAVQKGETVADSNKFGGFTPQEFRDSVTEELAESILTITGVWPNV